MQGPASAALTDRMIGAAKLDVPTYEAIEHDLDGTSQALIVVILAAVAGAIGSLRDVSVGGIVFGLLSAVLGWIIYSGMAYFVGTRLVPSSETSATPGELLRTLGFAQTPNLLAVFGFVPILGPLVALVGSIWTLVCSIVAIRQSLEMSTGRAIVVAILAAIILIIVLSIIAAIIGVSVYAAA